MGFVDSLKESFNPADGSSVDWSQIDWNKIDEERFFPKVGQKQTIPDAERLELACKESEDGVHGVVIEVYSVVDGPLKNKVIDVLPVFRWPDGVEIDTQEFKDWLDTKDEPTGLKSTIDSCFNLYGEISGVLYRYEEFYAKEHNGSSTGLEMDERGSKYIAEYNRWMYKSVEACKKACYHFLEYKFGQDILQEDTQEEEKKPITREDMDVVVNNFFSKEKDSDNKSVDKKSNDIKSDDVESNDVKLDDSISIMQKSFEDKVEAEKIFDSYVGISNETTKETQIENSINVNSNAIDTHVVNPTHSVLADGFVESFDEVDIKQNEKHVVQAVPKSAKLEQEFSGLSNQSEVYQSAAKTNLFDTKVLTNQNEELLSASDITKLQKGKNKDKTKSEPFRIWVRPEGFEKGYSGILIPIENNMYAYIPDENYKILLNSEKFKNWSIVFGKDKDFSFKVLDQNKVPTDFNIAIASLRKQLDKQQLKHRLVTHEIFQKNLYKEVGER